MSALLRRALGILLIVAAIAGYCYLLGVNTMEKLASFATFVIPGLLAYLACVALAAVGIRLVTK